MKSASVKLYRLQRMPGLTERGEHFTPERRYDEILL